MYQHREGAVHGFTRKYGVTQLVWFEAHDNVGAAYKREQRIKRWRRAWKLALIEKLNPNWIDLYPEIAGFMLPGRLPREGGAESWGLENWLSSFK